jgi:hypothetical protein
MQATLSIESDGSPESWLTMNPTLFLWQGIIDLLIPWHINQIDRTYLLWFHGSTDPDPTACNQQRMLQLSRIAFLKWSHKSHSKHNRHENANQSKKIQSRPDLKMAKYGQILSRSRSMVASILPKRQAMQRSDF